MSRASLCVICKADLSSGPWLDAAGMPLHCSWVPPGAGRTIYAIVSAHISCMGVLQLQQVLAGMQDEVNKLGTAPLVYVPVQRRLSELLATGQASSPETPGASRFSLLEIE